MKRRLGLPVIYVALFLSGAAALVYQATWGRMLHRVFGVSDQAIATVLAAFFLGLGIGAALGGRWGTRFRRPALTYAALEAGIGAFALLSLWMIPRVHGIYAAVGAETSGVLLTIIRLGIALALLLPPTILMGATLPVLIALMAPDRKVWATPATWLYATNTVGAMVGAGLTGLYLVPVLGARWAIVLAAVGSLVGAALVAAVWWEREVEEKESSEDGDAEVDSAEDEDAPPNRLVLAMVIAGMAGMAALASEVLWTRVLRMVLVGTTQAFSAMLVNYLAGIALGSLLAAELMRRGHRSSVLLGVSQLLLGVLTVVAMGVAPHLPRLIALLHRSELMIPNELWVILTVSGLLLFPIALVLGTSIPLCWHFARSKQKQAADHAGRILAANTIGGLLGSMVAGFGAVPLLGIEASLLCVMFMHLVIAGIVLQVATGPGLVRRVVAVAAPLALGMLLLSRGPTLHLAFLLGARAKVATAVLRGPDDSWWDSVIYFEEGRNTTVTVIETPGMLGLYNDGRPESHFLNFEPGIGAELVFLGALPSLYAEPRERALVVGLGAGHTATMLLAAPWKEVHVVELEGAVVNAARFMHEKRNKPFAVDDPRVRLTVDDGRAQLVLAAENSLDTVVSQPSHPWLAGSSALYTQEFFEEVRRALRPSGVFSLWVNTFRTEHRHIRSILTTLTTTFPNVNGYVVEDSSLILIASESPLVLGARARQRYDELELGKFLKAKKLDGFPMLVAARELDAPAVAALGHGAELLVDDRPALEFDLARLLSSKKLSLGDMDAIFAPTPWITPAVFGELPENDRLEILVKRIERISTRPVALERFAVVIPELDLTPVERAITKGTLAVARGEADMALGHFDSVESAMAASMSDRLRKSELRFRDMFKRSQRRQVGPDEPAALISAALALAEPALLEHAMEMSKATPRGRANKSLPVLAAMLDAGCAGVLALPPRLIADSDDEYALFLAERCAMEAAELAKATWFGNERARVRDGLAFKSAEAGIDHMTFGNVAGAIMHFRRALTKDPAYPVAAATLADVLAQNGDAAGAEQVLRKAYSANRGLPGASHIASVAARLGIKLEPHSP
jgi:spermidine synthase